MLDKSNLKSDIWANFHMRGFNLEPKKFNHSENMRDVDSEKAIMIDNYVMAKVCRGRMLEEEKAYLAGGDFRSWENRHEDVETLNQEMVRLENEFGTRYPGEALFGFDYQVAKIGNKTNVYYDHDMVDPALRGRINPKEVKEVMVDNYIEVEAAIEQSKQAEERGELDSEMWKYNRNRIHVLEERLSAAKADYAKVFGGANIEDIAHERPSEDVMVLKTAPDNELDELLNFDYDLQ